LSQHFGLSAAVMSLLAIAAASAIRRFDSATGRKKITDRDAFLTFVDSYFAWSDVGVEGEQHRAAPERSKAAAEALYVGIRNPLIHSAGVAASAGPTVQVRHVFPGLSDLENESAIEALCSRSTLDGQTVIQLNATSTAVHTRELYWAVRQAIQALSADRAAESDIRCNLVRVHPSG